MTKYTKEIKLAIYHEWVDDDRRGAYLSQKYGMRPGEIAYMVALLQRHGEGILDRPQQKYTADFKLAAIDRVLLGGEALRQVSLDLGLKIEYNLKHDEHVNEQLKEMDWTVLRFWSKPVLKNPEYYTQIILWHIKNKE